jgi:hypothetical protein
MINTLMVRLRSLVLAVIGLGVSLSHAAFGRDLFSGPTGDLGANLSTSRTDRSRAHMELSYFTGSIFPGQTNHALTLTTGAGLRLNHHFELAFGLAGEGILSSGVVSTNHYAIGNLTLGGNFIAALGPSVRLKVGAAVGLGPWNQSNNQLTAEGLVQVLAGAAIHIYQDAWYYRPSHLHIFFPSRVELEPIDSLVLTLDVQPDLAFGLNSNRTGAFFILAPGLVYWPSDSVALGFRLPIQTTSLEDDAAQIAFEPSLRFDVSEAAFLSTRFTLNLDGPGGFSFDTGRVWGLHLAAGGAF